MHTSWDGYHLVWQYECVRLLNEKPEIGFPRVFGETVVKYVNVTVGMWPMWYSGLQKNVAACGINWEGKPPPARPASLWIEDPVFGKEAKALEEKYKKDCVEGKKKTPRRAKEEYSRIFMDEILQRRILIDARMYFNKENGNWMNGMELRKETAKGSETKVLVGKGKDKKECCPICGRIKKHNALKHMLVISVHGRMREG